MGLYILHVSFGFNFNFKFLSKLVIASKNPSKVDLVFMYRWHFIWLHSKISQNTKTDFGMCDSKNAQFEVVRVA